MRNFAILKLSLALLMIEFWKNIISEYKGAIFDLKNQINFT
jgi:hypothetical protein